MEESFEVYHLSIRGIKRKPDYWAISLCTGLPPLQEPPRLFHKQKGLLLQEAVLLVSFSSRQKRSLLVTDRAGLESTGVFSERMLTLR